MTDLDADQRRRHWAAQITTTAARILLDPPTLKSAVNLPSTTNPVVKRLLTTFAAELLT